MSNQIQTSSSPVTREASANRPRLAVVIPFANEAATAEPFLRQVLEQIQPQDQIFCVVDTSSHDSTREKIEGLSALDSRVILVWAPENRSVVDAYFRGYRAALDSGCGWILEMDAGFSHSPQEIPKFLDAMAGGVEFAAGSRFIAGGSHRGNWLRYLVSRGGSVLTNLLLGTRMKDMTSGFECFTRRALARVVERGVESKAHFFQTEIRFFLHDVPWIEVPIHYACPRANVGSASVVESIKILRKLRRQVK